MAQARTKIITHQEGMQTKMVRSNVDVCFAGGVLNPQPLTSSILTPDGFKKIADLKAGDIVCGLGGTKQTVTHCDNEGPKDCIRVTLEDGSSAESALDHKWWIMKGGNEMTAISFELLESFEVCREKNLPYDTYIFRYLNEKPVPVRIVNVEDIGKKDVACIGVSNEDQLYITDDYLITKNCGKAQPLSAKILTPSGYVTMGELKKGMMICDTQGGKQEVLQVYEKGLRKIYKVKLLGGETRCSGDHLWTVYNRRDHMFQTISTKKLMRRWAPGKYFIQCPRPVCMEETSAEDRLPIPPYMLGKMLMEGCKGVSDETKNKLWNLLIVESFGNSIPQKYIFASLENRKALLRGILTKATNWNNDPDVFKLKIGAGPLLRGITDLVYSLGGYVEHFGDRFLFITLPDGASYRSRFGGDVDSTKPINLFRPILGIEDDGNEECRCILVSSEDHLYITDDFIPTHNTFGAILMVAEPTLDPRFRACFTRRNLGNLKAGGGIVDDFTTAYGNYVRITTSDNPRVQFPSGAFVDCLHIADESPDKLMERAKGWQYDLFYLDELTSYEFSTFSIVGTRCRGKAQWTGKIRGTTNPKRKHWVRKMLSWYIGVDGFIIPERDGVVRYYYQAGKDIDGLVWGNSKKEVYSLCKTAIDEKLAKLGNKDWTYEDMVRSFVFYSGKMSENKASVGHNKGYAGAVAAVGGARSQQLIEGNWNVDEEEDNKAPISSGAAQAVFTTDDCRNGDKWITVDLADVGVNNLVAIAWDGFHVFDLMFLGASTPRLNYERVQIFANRHGIPENRIIYDGTRAAYMYDYMPDAIAFISSSSPIGMYKLMSDRLKDECYLRLCDVISHGRMSIEEIVAKKRYVVQGVDADLTIQGEFLEECSVVRFREKPNGKMKLLSKKEMNQQLGKGRSMDILDPCAMRMYPCLGYQYGEELEKTSINMQRQETKGRSAFNIYDDHSWY